jgi:autotransporter-associated beta strand protein
MSSISFSLRLFTPLLIPAAAYALTISDYSGAENDRFSSGFPAAPVENTSGSIFGQGLDWSGVGWTSGFVRKGYGFVSPRHYMTARHFGGGSTILTFSQNQSIQSASQQGLENVGYGEILGGVPDIQMGTLATQMRNIRRYALLDLHASSSSNSETNYNSLPLLIYGHGGDESSSTRAGATTIAPDLFGARSIEVSGQQSRFLTPRSDVQLVTFDSGSPALYAWTNPNGNPELTLLGNHAAINDNYNFHNFFCTVEIFATLNGLMNDDGFSLRLAGDPSYTWEGSSSTSIDRNRAWGLGGLFFGSGATSDQYVLFDPATASSLGVTVDTNYNLRGLYFKSSTATGDAFMFSGTSVLTIGRGGITNYDDDTQSLTNDLALGAPQYWSIENGGVNLSSLNTNGHLIEIGGGGSVSISGAVSGSGGLALSEGTLILTGTSSYTGPTWVHGGHLLVEGDIGSSASLDVDIYGTLSGIGSVPLIRGGGSLSPGSSSGILTAESVDPSDGLDFDFEFSAASAPDFSSPGASVNDLFRITGAAPFVNPLGAENTIRIYLSSGALSKNQTFKGGFFTDDTSDFIASIHDATFEFYITDSSGGVSFNGQSYSAYDGPFLFALTTEPQDADFGQGSVSGRILQFVVTPDVTKYEGWKIFYDLSGDAALDAADEDHDGIRLLEEFAFGGDPTVYEDHILPTTAFAEENGSTYLELSFTRPRGLENISYTPQTTADLNAWPTDSTGIADPSPTPIDNGNNTETVTYRRAEAISVTEMGFIRIRISEGAP